MENVYVENIVESVQEMIRAVEEEKEENISQKHK